MLELTRSEDLIPILLHSPELLKHNRILKTGGWRLGNNDIRISYEQFKEAVSKSSVLKEHFKCSSDNWDRYTSNYWKYLKAVTMAQIVETVTAVNLNRNSSKIYSDTTAYVHENKLPETKVNLELYDRLYKLTEKGRKCFIYETDGLVVIKNLGKVAISEHNSQILNSSYKRLGFISLLIETNNLEWKNNPINF